MTHLYRFSKYISFSGGIHAAFYVHRYDAARGPTHRNMWCRGFEVMIHIPRPWLLPWFRVHLWNKSFERMRPFPYKVPT